MSGSQRKLGGHIAVVAGATRGAGRGIARGLGEAGATVYCVGRSVRGHPSPYARPETIEETAELVSAAGGRGIAVRVDATIEEEVRALFERVARDDGRLDVLANSIAGEDPGMTGWTSFWETGLADATGVLQRALLSHVMTAKHAAPLMIRRRRGLIVEVVENDLLFSSGNVLGQLVRFALKGFVQTMAAELKPHRVAALAITPGFLRSESMLDAFGVTAESWRDGARKDPNFLESESPLFLGRAVAALASDPQVAARSGDLTSSWEVAREFGLVDADGEIRDWGAHARRILPSLGPMKAGVADHAAWLERLARRARALLADGEDAGTPPSAGAHARARSAAPRERARPSASGARPRGRARGRGGGA